MAGKKSEEKRAYWQEILDRQAESGLSVRRFCAKERVSEPSFYAWRKKLGMRKDDRVRQQPTGDRKDQSDNGRLFVPLQVLDTGATLEIAHPLGYRIQITGDVNPVALRQVIEVLDDRGGR